ncbi:hypothetical protein PRZ48_006710 [Zasmidium cellare]|uniref:Clathrin light chain n=1 Tax=Zasmidium cellare TaxID=395010 RepID=A0ABR0ENV1_ZASCE|nr:hypothetical protein PRZ48_006710 [Zasmidium cellare]
MQNSDDMSPSAAASDREQHAAQRDYEEASSIEGDWSIPDETFEGTFTEFTDEDPLLAQEETPLGPCDGGEETVDDEPEGTPSEDAWSTEDEAEDAEPTAEQVDFAQSLQAFGRSSEFTVAKRTAWETLTSRPSKHMYGL